MGFPHARKLGSKQSVGEMDGGQTVDEMVEISTTSAVAELELPTSHCEPQRQEIESTTLLEPPNPTTHSNTRLQGI